MKRLFYISLISLSSIAGFTSCELDTNPTDKLSGDDILSSADGIMTSLNGVYRSMYSYKDWSSGYPTENFGIASVNICSEVMGEDMIIREPGSYWFFYDQLYWVRYEVNNKSDRPYTWWNMYYQIINNANNIIDKVDVALGDEKTLMNLKAQALSLRAYGYFNLIRHYQRTYVGHEDDPGVPLYTQATIASTKGKGRGTVKEVYEQINNDLDLATELFEESGKNQTHLSHFDLYVAQGLKARVALTQEDFDAAEAASDYVIANSSKSLMAKNALKEGFNSVTNQEWLWGSEIYESQATGWYSFFSHMDATTGHATRCRKIASAWLYDMIDDQDIRKDWFVAPNGMTLAEENAAGLDTDKVSYNQVKFRLKAAGSYAADYIYMRLSEMYLIKAEALVRKSNPDYAGAIALLETVIGYKYENPADYSAYINGLTKSSELTLKSTESKNVVTLMDEIILQRRIELWGEGFRIYDIMRLKTGFDRSYEGNNSNVNALRNMPTMEPDSWDPIMMIPVSEFDGNEELDYDRDQNP